MSIDPVTESPPRWLSVSAVSSGPCLVVAVAGEADWNTADQLRDQLTQALAYGPRSVILDLADLEFCNLRGLDALNEFCEVAQKSSVDVSIRGISRQLRWLFDCLVTGLGGDHAVCIRASRPLLRAVPALSTGSASSWDSRAPA